jgi:transcriptional regulator of acetoin/glycerol metabolism
VRELRDVIERGVILARGDRLMPGDLPPELTRSAPSSAPSRSPSARSSAHARAHDWNRQATARALDINRTTLFNKMRKYGLLDLRFHPLERM